MGGAASASAGGDYMSETLEAAISDLIIRMKRLERITGVGYRDIPIPCPFCGPESKTVVAISTAPDGHYASRCGSCGAKGPDVDNAQDATWCWNQFVSHRGKVPRE